MNELGQAAPRGGSESWSLVQTSGGHMAWWAVGAGPPVLLLHGIPSSSVLWRSVVPTLARQHEVHVVDLLGYGRSDKPVDVDLGIAAQARYLSELLATVGWQGGTLVGHDIGGGVAQLFALAHPDSVTSMVLVDSVAYDSWPEPGIKRLADPEWDQIIHRIDLKTGFRKALTRGVRNEEVVTDDLVASFVAPFDDEQGRASYLRCARSLRTSELLDAMSAIEQLAVPTLLVWGTHDDFQPVRYGKRLAGRMKEARLVTLDAGHFLPLEKGPELASEIKGFLGTGHGV